MKETGRFHTIRDLPIVGRIAGQFDNLIGNHGFQGAMRELIKRSGSRLEVDTLPVLTEAVLRGNRVLVICNHPHDIETFAVSAAIPDREDLFFIGSHNLQGIGENLARHIIPVYIGKHEKGDGSKLKLSVRIGRQFKLGPSITDEEAHVLNEQSILQAAEKITHGAMVVLFPEGPKGKEGRWLDGIGFLLYQLRNTPETQVVFANVRGTSDKDVLRLIPGMSRFFPTVKVSFSKPISLERILKEAVEIDPDDKTVVKETAKKLRAEQEQAYKQWLEGLDDNPTDVIFKQILPVVGPHALDKEPEPVQFQLDPLQDNEAFFVGYRKALTMKGLYPPEIEEIMHDLEVWMTEAKTAGKKLNIRIASRHTSKWFE